MAEGLQIKAGNYGFSLQFIINNADGTPKDLTGLNAVLNVWTDESNPTESLIISKPITILQPTLGIVQYTVQQNDFTTPGTYFAEIQLSSTGYLESTQTFTIQVIAEAP